MATDSDRLSCKRSAENVEDANMPSQPPAKRSKDGSIMDYMQPKPQSRPRPQRKQRSEAAEAASKYWSKAGSSSQKKTKPRSPSSTNDDRQDKTTTSQPNDAASPTIPSGPKTLTLIESTGNIFSTSPNTLLIHACNCEGSWGAGIALAFKKNYPSAFKTYASHCRSHTSDSLFGTALLIPPQKPDYSGPAPSGNKSKPPQSSPPTFIACLFTSRSKGRKKDSPSQILEATGPAMLDLLQQVRKWNAKTDDSQKVEQVRMCKINSGLFAVPWEETRAVLEEIEVQEGDVEVIEVVSREE